jgi:23S rRNA pseudouridine1911/1915/1917 synthase
LLSAASVRAFLAATSLGFVACTAVFLLEGNAAPLELSLPTLAWICGYSYAKRFTSLSHFWLGAALMLAPAAAWVVALGWGAQKLIEDGRVMVNGRPGKSSTRIRHGDKLRFAPPSPPHPEPVAEEIPLDILYQDEFLAVINKPANMVVHPAKGNWSGTLVNALRFHFPQLSGINGDYRAGIVHRLDRDTSGAILIAKEENTHRDLAMLFETRKVFKEYAVIAQGTLDRDSDYVEKRIMHHPTDRVRMIVTDKDIPEAKEAVSYYEVAERFRGFTFVKFQPRTGRTHQIRVHIASLGCPVLADIAPLQAGQEDKVLLTRQALHAHRLRFIHPRLEKMMEFVAPLPRQLEDTLEALRRLRPWRG